MTSESGKLLGSWSCGQEAVDLMISHSTFT